MIIRAPVRSVLLLSFALISGPTFAQVEEPQATSENPEPAEVDLPQPEGGRVTVQDTPLTIPGPLGETYDVYPSTSTEGRFYVAPVLNFVPLRSDGEAPVFANFSSLDEERGVAQLKLLLSTPRNTEAIEEALVVRQMENNQGNLIPAERIQVDLLTVDAIRLDLFNESFQEVYSTRPFILPNPPTREEIDVEFQIGQDGEELVRRINSGEITLNVTYGYNQVNLDEARRSLSLRQVLDSDYFRQLQQEGKELFAAEQAANIATAVRTEITDISYPGLGQIDEQTLSVEDLMEAFDLQNTALMSTDELADLETRLNEQLDLQLDPEEFQPFRVNKEVVEVLNQETTTAERREAYLSSPSPTCGRNPRPYCLL